jgi:hypothetical protein
VLDVRQGPLDLLRYVLDMLGKIAMGGAWRLQAIVATPVPMAGGGVMTVEAQDFFIADLDADGRTATAFSLDLQKA